MEENIMEQPTSEPLEEKEENSVGSIYGKFKDAKSLLDAYNSLQAEFTRKSQKLAEIQKENENNAFFKQENLEKILDGKDDNDKYKKEITEMIAEDSELGSLPNKYQVAYKIITESEKKVAQTLNDHNFIDKYIENNNGIRETIISNYLSSLNNISTTPKVISGNPTSIYFAPNTDKPRTLKEAGEVFSKMLK